ncbi:DUF1622 domain-containing protein [Micromonospora sp. KC721]|uniref:DUF1622 domain-containing protein n=1 Tax=Micromonospora sp. KC721 TaxID=2530380 RepID=UPI0010472876|nr:DUF1622 domain-containing protein [Micromonospora sp. KC721]TDB73529.1 DUF1622 domain-containing protein [Micromonospora sp. KC721]
MDLGELLRQGDRVAVTLVEAAGALVIVEGAGWAAVRFVAEGVRRRGAAVLTPIRLSLGRFLTLGLEFQLAADILRTAFSPSFDQIARLAAVAAIRTALNYFLRREITQEQRQVGEAAPERTT